MSPPTLRIYSSELDVIVAETLRFPDTETGGDLFGLFSHGGQATVFLATRPASQAVREVHHFQQDPETHMRVEALLWTQMGVQCVGLWHSHHRLGLHRLSDGDLRRTRRYCARHGRASFVDVLSWVEGRRGGVGAWSTSHDRTQRQRIEVLPGRSPIRNALRGRTGGAAALRGARRGSAERATLAQPMSLEEELAGVIEAVVPVRLMGGITIVKRAGGLLLRIDDTERGRTLLAQLDEPLRFRVGEIRDAQGRARTLAFGGEPAADLRSGIEHLERRRDP